MFEAMRKKESRGRTEEIGVGVLIGLALVQSASWLHAEVDKHGGDRLVVICTMPTSIPRVYRPHPSASVNVTILSTPSVRRCYQELTRLQVHQFAFIIACLHTFEI